MSDQIELLLWTLFGVPIGLIVGIWILNFVGKKA